VSLKESNDAISMPAGKPADTRRSAVDYLALAVATCGVGYFPIAPGTWGSLLGVGAFLSIGGFFKLQSAPIDSEALLNLRPGLLTIELAAILLITCFGVWGASRAEKLLGRKDPGKVVIDEVAGQMISLLPLALLSVSRIKISIIISFFLFRVFDIVKPYPARRCEALHGGLGIMVDDLVAGIYGALVTAALIILFQKFY
jgi:phosphatidylglycerophosphatase A